MNVAVDAVKVAGSLSVYRLRIVTEGASVAALLPAEVALATLAVNGVVVQSAGRHVNINQQPFGHGASSFRLGALKRSDRVEITEYGAGGVPEIVAMAATATAYRSGLGSGLFYGILSAIAIFQLLGGSTMRDHTRLWYVGWIFAVIGIELLRDDVLPVANAVAEHVMLLLDVCANICSVGFGVTYLKLFSESRRLFWILISVNVLLMVSIMLVGTVTRAPVNNGVFFGALSAGLVVTILVALLRRKAGFLPASYLAFGVLGLLTAFVSEILRDVTYTPSPFFDRWAIDLGGVFDFSVFSLGIFYRSRFTQAQRSTLESALHAANVVASTDELTGLLNRRGFEVWLQRVAQSGTLLYIDLDGFKAVNDEGGHAAGDDTLIAVARILRHAVRSQDIVARFGGDEFVVLLVECDNPTVVQAIVAGISSGVDRLRPLGPQSRARIGVSIGSADLIDKNAFAETLSRADADAYRVKAEHRSVSDMAHRRTEGRRAAS